MIYDDDTTYEGHFHNGLHHGGKGLLSSALFTYKGYFLDHAFHGMGLYISKSETYKGFFENGKKNGYGEWTGPYKEKFEGTW